MSYVIGAVLMMVCFASIFAPVRTSTTGAEFERAKELCAPLGGLKDASTVKTPLSKRKVTADCLNGTTVKFSEK